MLSFLVNLIHVILLLFNPQISFDLYPGVDEKLTSLLIIPPAIYPTYSLEYADTARDHIKGWGNLAEGSGTQESVPNVHFSVESNPLLPNDPPMT